MIKNNKKLFFILIIIFVVLTSSCSQSLKVNLKHNGEVNYGRPLTIVIFGQTKTAFMKTTVADVMQRINAEDTYRVFVTPIRDKEVEESYLVPVTNKKGLGFYFLFLKNSNKKQWKRFVSEPGNKIVLINIKNNHIVSFKVIDKNNWLGKVEKLNPFAKKKS